MDLEEEGEEVWEKRVELREFQQACYEAAMKRNTIIVGPTGIGKTLVAIQLLRAQDYTDGR